MKPVLRIIALILSITILCGTSVSATEPEPRANSNIQHCNGYLEISSTFFVRVHFSINAIGYMDELGASMIRIQRSADGSAWEICDTYWASDHPEMIGSGYMYTSSVTYQGQPGYQYRAFIYFRAKNANGTYTNMAYAY